MNYLNLGHPDRQLICDLCKQFYELGWASGTGGSISLRDEDGNILIAPSGVQKERLNEEDLYVIDMEGKVLLPSRRPTYKVSECAPLFLHAYRKRNAGAVIHSHSINAVMASIIANPASGEPPSRFTLVTGMFPPATLTFSGFEMIKGLRGKGCFDKVEIPIIENTAKECDLADSLGAAMDHYPDVDIVVVRGHGAYVWGADWKQAKTQAECYDYLFELAFKMRGIGL